MNLCTDEPDESYRCGDDYYRAMTLWSTSLKTKESAKRCVSLARIYERALDKLIECLTGSTLSLKTSAYLAQASEYKQDLIADIEILAGFLADNPQPQVP
jgi:hypothetical protein